MFGHGILIKTGFVSHKKDFVVYHDYALLFSSPNDFLAPCLAADIFDTRATTESMTIEILSTYDPQNQLRKSSKLDDDLC